MDWLWPVAVLAFPLAIALCYWFGEAVIEAHDNFVKWFQDERKK
ncbi:MAG: hypothetical protein ACRD22_07975 [Terriglobia bacterium]